MAHKTGNKVEETYSDRLSDVLNWTQRTKALSTIWLVLASAQSIQKHADFPCVRAYVREIWSNFLKCPQFLHGEEHLQSKTVTTDEIGNELIVPCTYQSCSMDSHMRKILKPI